VQFDFLKIFAHQGGSMRSGKGMICGRKSEFFFY
jgi:hypothetical protein